MAISIGNLRWNLDEGDEVLLHRACRVLGWQRGDIRDWQKLRVSVDARKKNDIHFRCQVALVPKDAALEAKTLQHLPNGAAHFAEPTLVIAKGTERLEQRPIVIGAGPAGYFAAYLLAKEGYVPIVIERGRRVEDRTTDVEALFSKGKLNEESNVLFGEGGAGTFSDGKLTSRSKDPLGQMVPKIFAQFGAPKEICYQAKPHIGTDQLRRVLKNMRQAMQDMGADFYFETQVDGLLRDASGALRALRMKGANEGEIVCSACVLATGHSARDVFHWLHEQDISLEPKDFAVGLRVEHRQADIDRAQYGSQAGNPRLGAAEYQLTARSKEGRGVYTFCMCPGGLVIPAMHEAGTLAVNGMSRYARNSPNANSAVVVQTGPSEYGSGLFDGMNFQKSLEEAAYLAGGVSGCAPVQRYGDFMEGRKGNNKFGSIKPTYRPDVRPANLAALLPRYCSDGIAYAMEEFAKRTKGFNNKDAIFTGVETRTSSPIRIVRGEDRQALGCSGLYPTGEGAGYAGGIVSAAIDGMRSAEAIMQRYQPIKE